MPIDFAGQNRDRIAELACCHILTPSVELQARTAVANRARSGKAVQGYAVAAAALRAAAKRFGEQLLAWQAANPGETPNLEALLNEDA